MKNEQFEREMTYQTALAIARIMLSQGVIEDGDFDKMEAAFCMKFCPLIGALYGREPLIYGRFQGRLSHRKEGAICNASYKKECQQP